MKKILIVTLVVLMSVSVLAGCAPKAAETKIGLASITSYAKSKDVSTKDGAPVAGLAEADTIMAAVSVGDDGKIVTCDIDFVLAKVNFDATGKVTTDKATEVKTKRELGDAYGMKAASALKKEWFEQADAIEKWMIGKTVEQIKAMKTKTLEGGKVITDEADLKTSATIGITDYVNVVVKAVANAK